MLAHVCLLICESSIRQQCVQKYAQWEARRTVAVARASTVVPPVVAAIVAAVAAVAAVMCEEGCDAAVMCEEGCDETSTGNDSEATRQQALESGGVLRTGSG